MKVLNDILAIPEGKYNIDMDSYCSVIGTEVVNADPSDPNITFCILGILAHEAGYPEDHWEEDHFNYSSFGASLVEGSELGSEPLSGWERVASYIFYTDCMSKDGLLEAKARAQYVLDNGNAPKGYRSYW